MVSFVRQTCKCLIFTVALCAAGNTRLQGQDADWGGGLAELELMVTKECKSAIDNNDYRLVKAADLARVNFARNDSKKFMNPQGQEALERVTSIWLRLAQTAYTMRNAEVRPKKYWFYNLRSFTPSQEIAELVRRKVKVEEIDDPELRTKVTQFLEEKKKRLECYDRERTLEYILCNSIHEVRPLLVRMCEGEGRLDFVCQIVSDEKLRSKILSTVEKDPSEDLSFLRSNDSAENLAGRFEVFVQTNFFLARQTEDEKYLKRIASATQEYTALLHPPTEKLTSVWRELLWLSHEMWQTSRRLDKPLDQIFKPSPDMMFFILSKFEPEDIDGDEARETYIRCRDEYNRLIKRYDRKNALKGFETFIVNIGRNALEGVKDNPPEIERRKAMIRECIKDDALQARILETP